MLVKQHFFINNVVKKLGEVKKWDACVYRRSITSIRYILLRVCRYQKSLNHQIVREWSLE